MRSETLPLGRYSILGRGWLLVRCAWKKALEPSDLLSVSSKLKTKVYTTCIRVNMIIYEDETWAANEKRQSTSERTSKQKCMW